jgi:hypothetical protein
VNWSYLTIKVLRGILQGDWDWSRAMLSGCDSGEQELPISGPCTHNTG